MADYVHRYLSEQHAANPDKGYPVAALGTEVDRESEAHKEEIARDSERLVSILMQGLEGKSDEKRAKALSLFAVFWTF